MGRRFHRADVSVDDFCKTGCLEGCCLQGGMFVGMLFRWGGCFMGRRYHRGDVSGDDICRAGCLEG